MTFTTTLFKLLESASSIDMGGYDVDDDMLTLYSTSFLQANDPRHRGYYEIDLSEHHGPNANVRLYDQEAVVDSDGQCNATATDGETVTFTFRVSRPITLEDL